MHAWVALGILMWSQSAPAEKDCKELVQKMEASVMEDDGTWLDAALDKTLLCDRILKDLPADDKFKTSVRNSMKTAIKFGTEIAGAVQNAGATYKFLRIRTVNGQTRALFRLVHGDGGLNYHEFLLEKGADGQPHPTDVFIAVSGEWISESLRRQYLMLLSSQPGFLAKLAGKENEYAKALPKIKEMGLLNKQQKGAESLKIYDALPESVRGEKFVLLARYQAAALLGGPPLQEAIKAYRQKFPDDPSLPLLSFAPQLESKEFKAAMESIEKIDRAVGGDPFLECKRAEVHLESGAPDKAREAALKAIEREKTLNDGYWMMVTISLREKKFADTSTWLTRIEKELKIEIEDLTKIDVYAEYVKSPEHAAWKKSHEK